MDLGSFLSKIYSIGCEEFKPKCIVGKNSSLIKCDLVIFSSKPFTQVCSAANLTVFDKVAQLFL